MSWTKFETLTQCFKWRNPFITKKRHTKAQTLLISGELTDKRNVCLCRTRKHHTRDVFSFDVRNAFYCSITSFFWEYKTGKILLKQIPNKTSQVIKKPEYRKNRSNIEYVIVHWRFFVLVARSFVNRKPFTVFPFHRDLIVSLLRWYEQFK